MVSLSPSLLLVFFVGLSAWTRAAIINGKIGDIRDYPHTVKYAACVGTLISDRWVLTAAHCHHPWSSTVRILVLPFLHQVEAIKKIVKHPRYRLGDNFYPNGTKSEIYATYDYMLIELYGSVRSARWLPLDDGPEPPAGTKATYPSLSSVENENVLSELNVLYGELYTLSDAECARRLQNFDPATMLCATGGPPAHTGACYGDSGSGLVADGRLLGVLSWVEGDAVGCGADRTVVAARLSAPEIRRWIRDVLRGDTSGDHTTASATTPWRIVRI